MAGARTSELKAVVYTVNMFEFTVFNIDVTMVLGSTELHEEKHHLNLKGRFKQVFNIDVTMVLGSTEYELEKGALSNLLQPAVVVRIRDRNSNVIGKTSKGKKKLS
jgi:2C-methyl-D-erythritol 2,4-cyclodiphosphate synthase